MPPRKKAATVVDDRPSPADLMAAINKQFGDGTITMASDSTLEVTRTPTGVLPIDHLLDGGIPRGRFMEIYGPYSTLKSYVLYKALAATQKAGGAAALIDTEHSFDPEWAEWLGVNLKELPISRPATAEKAMGAMEALIRQKYNLVGFDSIAAAIPQQHQEVAPGEDTQPGALARVMSKGLARLNAANSHTSGIFINQTRQKIGVTFGSPITTSGGLAMGFYASYRMSFTRIEKITETYKQWDGTTMVDAKRVVAHRIKATLEKSKLSAPHGDSVFLFDLRTGQVDDLSYLIGLGLEKGLLERSASGHWTIPGVLDKAIHGGKAFNKFMNENEEVVEWLKEQTRP